jgi:hypothetical protein
MLLADHRWPTARRLAVPGIVPKLSRTPGGHRRNAPALGQDTDAVLREARPARQSRSPGDCFRLKAVSRYEIHSGSRSIHAGCSPFWLDQLSDSIRSMYCCIASSLGALEPVPGVPLGAPDHVAKAGLLLGVVARCRALLVQRVDLEQRGVVGRSLQVLGIGYGGFELRL